MRSYHRYLIIALALALFLHSTTALRLPLDIRQDEEGPLSKESAVPSRTRAEPTPSRSLASEESPRSTSQSESLSQKPTDVASSTTTGAPDTILQAPAATTTAQVPTSTGVASDHVLPIHPKITPAMGLSGVILLISGAVYAVIGIKNKWLYVFASAAYLSSLAVTVLIVYLMSPPVSDAIQGAFFVAAFLTGLIFGGLALVFHDITDGLGCMLGGFCLSMWFLTLKEGGLISSQTGRAIFIAAMSVAGFSLSFSHYTRTHGLIVSISFSGATATMLGVDCLSRAGWKEFWLYLWDLNSNIFPLETNTYPITRGIRVEVACVVLLSLFGIVSQLRLWRLVKERREKNAAARLEREEHRAREEEELGRRIEDDFSRERAQWEATYGDKTVQQDSVMDGSTNSTAKTSTSVREYEESGSNSMEMEDLSPKEVEQNKSVVSRSNSKQAPTGPTVTVTALEEDHIQQIDEQGNPVAPNRLSVRHSDVPTSATNSARGSAEIQPSGINSARHSVSARNSVRSSVAQAPVVVPLPFKIPTEEDAQSRDEDNASVSAVPDSIHESIPNPKRRLSKRLSGASALKRFSGHRYSRDMDDDEELIIPHIEDDRASSLAATLDDENDDISLPSLSAPQSPIKTIFEEPTEHLNTPGIDKQSATESDQKRVSSNGTPTSDHIKSIEMKVGTSNTGLDVSHDPEETDATRAVPQSLTVSTDPKSGDTRSKRGSVNTQRRRSDTMVSPTEEEGERSQQSKSGPSESASQVSRTGSRIGLSKDVLPEKMSKVAMSYRTNEWAKHLALAEQPEVEEIPEPEEPGVRLQNISEEQPAPVSNEISGLQPVKAKRNSKRTSTGSNAPRQSTLLRSASSMSRISQLEPVAQTPAPVAPRAVSRSGSRAQNNGLRSSSSPLLAQPIDPAVARASATPSPMPSSTLLGQRESMVRNKVSTQSFITPQTSTPNLNSPTEPDDMTLAQRKQLIQHQRPPSASAQYRQSNWGIGGIKEGFDSHQPRRLSGGMDPNRRELMLANWRESMRNDAAPTQANASSEDARRIAMLNERRQMEMREQQRTAAMQQRESMMDNMMRTGGMMDAHREAMRRMQANANRNAS